MHTFSMPRDARRDGFTLLEMVVAMATGALLMSAIGGVFNTLSSGATEVTRALLAQKDVHRARILFLEDLQAVDTLNADKFGEPYFQVMSVDRGTDNSIVFRKVERYQVVPGEDRVSAVFGPQIRYRLDENGSLVREEGGRRTVVGNGFAQLRFSLSDEGTITVTLTPGADPKKGTAPRAHELRIAPRNNLPI